VKSGAPLLDGGSLGAKQLNLGGLPAGENGSGPLNGKNPKFGSFAGKVAIPSAPTSTDAGEDAISQWSIGFQPGADDDTPSHCSMFVVPTPCGNPDATTVNDNGFPAASPGTGNGFVDGVVIVPANAAPANSASVPRHAPRTTASRRFAKDMRCHPCLRPCDPSIMRRKPASRSHRQAKDEKTQSIRIPVELGLKHSVPD
jgi:hypothetical protein